MREISEEFRRAMLMYADEKLDGSLPLLAKVSGASRANIYRIKNGEQLTMGKKTYDKLEVLLRPYLPLVAKDRNSGSLQHHFLITSIAENLQNYSYKQLKDFDKLTSNKRALIESKVNTVLKTLDYMKEPMFAWDTERSECLGMNRHWEMKFDVDKEDIEEYKLEDLEYWVIRFSKSLSDGSEIESKDNGDFTCLFVVKIKQKEE